MPSFNLEETVELHTLRRCIRNFDDLVKGSDHVKLWVELFSETCIVTSSNRTTEEPRGNPSWWVGLVKVGDAVCGVHGLFLSHLLIALFDVKWRGSLCCVIIVRLFASTFIKPVHWKCAIL